MRLGFSNRTAYLILHCWRWLILVCRAVERAGIGHKDTNYSLSPRFFERPATMFKGLPGWKLGVRQEARTLQKGIGDAVKCGRKIKTKTGKIFLVFAFNMGKNKNIYFGTFSSSCTWTWNFGKRSCRGGSITRWSQCSFAAFWRQIKILYDYYSSKITTCKNIL